MPDWARTPTWKDSLTTRPGCHARNSTDEANYLAQLDKTRPALVLTHEIVRQRRQWVTIAPVTSTVRGLTTELAVGPANGLDHHSVVNLDNIATIPASALGRQIGRLLPAQEQALTAAIHAAFDLDAR